MQKKNGQNVFTPTSSFCSTRPPPSPIAHPLLPRSGVSHATGNASLRACGSSGRMADNALLTSYEPNKTDSKTCIDVRSKYAPINIAVRREIFDIEDDLKFAVAEDPDHFPQQAVGSQRSVASTVPALMNLDSWSSTGKPEQCDESVASVNRNMSRTQVDRDQNSAERPCLRKYLESESVRCFSRNLEPHRAVTRMNTQVAKSTDRAGHFN